MTVLGHGSSPLLVLAGAQRVSQSPMDAGGWAAIGNTLSRRIPMCWSIKTTARELGHCEIQFRTLGAKYGQYLRTGAVLIRTLAFVN
jgi:hypothetical protein